MSKILKYLLPLLLFVSTLSGQYREYYNAKLFSPVVIDSLVLQTPNGSSKLTIYYDDVGDTMRFYSPTGTPIAIDGLTFVLDSTAIDAEGFIPDAEFQAWLNQDVRTTASPSFVKVYLDQIAAPAWSEGMLFYDDATGALSFFNAESDVTLQIGEEVWVSVRNETGVTIPDFTPVYVSGASGNRALIAKAQANVEATSHVLGVTTHAIEHNSNGYITVSGSVNGVDTDGSIAGEVWTDGEDLYLSAATAGQFTDTKPSGADDWVVEIGHVLTAANSGSFLLHIRNDGVLDEDVAITQLEAYANTTEQIYNTYMSLKINDWEDHRVHITPRELDKYL